MFKKIIPFILIISLILFFSLQTDNNLAVHFLDIGQGDAILIRTPDGQNVLIDGGPDNKLIYEVAEHLPWWERTIDYLVISHYHADHYLGFVELLNKYQVKNILITSHQPDDLLYKIWQEKLSEYDIKPQVVSRGEKFVINNDLYWQILAADSFHEDYNDNSIVIKLTHGQTDFLFTGDLPIEGEKILLQEFDLNSEILKIAHHGSKYSSSLEFLQAVQPEICVIQYGDNNKFGHPHQETLERLENINCQIEREISILSNGQTYWIDI